MRNEMGNNNVSGIKAEEKKAAAEVPKKPPEAFHADEAETIDFHVKNTEPSNYHSAAKESNAQRTESNETETGDKEHLDDSHFPEALTEAKTSVIQDSEIEKAASPDEGIYQKSLEPNLEQILSLRSIPQIHDNSSIQKDTDTEQVEGSNSTDSKPSNDSVRTLENNRYPSLCKSQQVLKTSLTCNIEEKEAVKSGSDRKEDIVDLVPEESLSIEDESKVMSISKGKYDTESPEDKARDGLESKDDCEVPHRVTLSCLPDSPLEDFPQGSSLGPSAVTLESQEKCVVHAEDIGFIHGESEDGNNKQDPANTNSSEQTMNPKIIENSAPPKMPPETCRKKNGDENVIKLSSRLSLEKISHAERVKGTHKRSKSILADNTLFDPVEIFGDTEEVIKMLPTTIPVSTEFSPTGKYDHEEGAATEKKEDLSSSVESNRNVRGTAEDYISSSRSFKWENDHLAASPAPQPNSCPLESSISDKEFVLNVQTTLGTLAETEALSGRLNEQYAIGETSPLPNCKAQESSSSFELNPNHPVNRVHTRKSPSFDFGVPLDARSEESDQTPLLLHDKSATRTFPGCANIRLQNRIAYGRKSLDYEPVTVEEKTIRMERSDSEVSSSSFVSILKKDEKANVESTPPKQEIHVADKKQEELEAEELELTSTRRRGKRKPRSSLFGACMCCTAAIR